MSHESVKQDAWKKFLVSGGVTVCFELCLGHSLEYLKISKQVAPVGTNYGQIVKTIIGQRSVFAFLDGFFPWGLIQAASKGSVFGASEVVSRKLLRLSSLSEEQQIVLSGGMAGFVQGLVLSPMLLLKTRVMTDKSASSSSPSSSLALGLRVLREGEIMKGALAFSLKRFADWTTRYIFAGACERVLFEASGGTKKGLSGPTTAQQAVGGLMGGVLSTLVTIPLDVLVAQIQQRSNAGKKLSVWQTMRHNFTSGQLLSGFLPRVLHVALTTAMLRTLTNKVYELIT